MSLGLIQENQQPIIKLASQWRFEIGDKPVFALPDHDDSNWTFIKVPAPWENVGFPGYDGYAWYRTWFQVPEDIKLEDLYLKLGRIDDVDEVYLNGEKIGFSGQFPPNYKTAWDQVRIYKLPANLLKPAENNLIAIRIYDYHISGGIYEGPLGIYYMPHELELKVDCSGKWKFSRGDSSHWRNTIILDNAWEQITVSKEMDLKSKQSPDEVAWYRKQILIPSRLANRKLVFITGQKTECEKVYFNGELISAVLEGQKANKASQNLNASPWQYFAIPPDLIQYDKLNTLALRICTPSHNGSILTGPIGITTEEIVQKYSQR